MYRRRSRYELIFSLLIIIVYFFMWQPLWAIAVSALLIGGYALITKVREKSIIDNGKRMRREAALYAAKIYLAPYQDIWKNLRLSNKHCSIRLGTDGHSISVKEKVKDSNSYRSFRIIESRVHDYDDLWNMFCLNFDSNKTYDGLLDDCRLYDVVVVENSIASMQKTINKPEVEKRQVDVNDVKLIHIENKPRLDINNCSEIELTELPGISIVMAKKIIKKREEIGGFKNLDDFFLFLKLKPHMQTQLNSLVCVNKMKGSLNIERYQERSVDL